MLSQIRPALVMLVVMTLLTGLAYPLAVTGIAQALFPAQANGSLDRDADGQVIGSALSARPSPATATSMAGPRRPATATTPPVPAAAISARPAPALIAAVKDRAAALGATRRRRCRSISSPPRAAASTRDISPAAADFQVARVAKARGLDPDAVRALVAAAHRGADLRPARRAARQRAATQPRPRQAARSGRIVRRPEASHGG